MITAQRLQDVAGRYLKENSLEFCQAVVDNFVFSARQHIVRVNTLASFLGRYYPYHDLDKFDSPFYYLLQYQHSGNKLEDVVSDVGTVTDLIGQAVWRHTLSRPHHPESWDRSLSLDMYPSKDESRAGFDARTMNEEALDECVCDHMALSIQLHDNLCSIYGWLNSNISAGKGRQWIMTEQQQNHIFRTTRILIDKLQDKTRKVYFDVDGVLRDMIGYFLGTPDDDWDARVDGKNLYEKLEEDFSVLERMPPMDYVPVVRQFTDRPDIITAQIEEEAREATTRWVLKHFRDANIIFVGNSEEKNSLLSENDRIFDDHPRFPWSPKLIIAGHGYNVYKHGFRINDICELEAVLEVLRHW